MIEKKDPTTAMPVRTAGVQRRGVERRRALLDAAEALLSEKGYEAATLKAIGDRAGIPIASVYHYFADRHQVEIELAQRHLRDLDAYITPVLHLPKARSLRDVVDAVIDRQLDYYNQHPGFLQLWYAGDSKALTDMARSYQESLVKRLRHYLVQQGLLRPSTPLLVLHVAFMAGDTILDAAYQHDPEGDNARIKEARRLVTAYLETYGPQASS
ncbi:TetR/AcrR family transcriptional regulator [Paraburkholderia sp. Se-20369]|nr:TetR/AcrR family transcriptional regulator [Paraburkholderia sp. Se-20369]